MVYVVSVLIICLSGLIGRRISSVYVFRDKFFKDMTSMIAFFYNNLTYTHAKVEKLFDDFIKTRLVFDVNKFEELKVFVVQKDISCKQLNKKSFNFLKNDERIALENFFADFGTSDLDSERNKLAELKKYLDKKSQEVEDHRKKNEGLVYKLSLAVGAVFCILIV